MAKLYSFFSTLILVGITFSWHKNKQFLSDTIQLKDICHYFVYNSSILRDKSPLYNKSRATYTSSPYVPRIADGYRYSFNTSKLFLSNFTEYDIRIDVYLYRLLRFDLLIINHLHVHTAKVRSIHFCTKFVLIACKQHFNMTNSKKNSRGVHQDRW